MAKVAIELPPDLADFVEQQSGGDLGSPEAEAYVLRVVEAAMERRTALVADIRRGLESGDSGLSIEDIWERAVEQAKSRAA